LSDTIPTFGKRDPGTLYVPRPSAYVLLLDDTGRLAIVISPQGTFLPGGGVDEGESYDQAAIREAREECGFVVTELKLLCNATQYVRSLKYQQYFEKQCRFFTGIVEAREGTPEPDHTTVWLSREQALAALTHESHRYAVNRLFSPGT